MSPARDPGADLPSQRRAVAPRLLVPARSRPRRRPGPSAATRDPAGRARRSLRPRIRANLAMLPGGIHAAPARIPLPGRPQRPPVRSLLPGWPPRRGGVTTPQGTGRPGRSPAASVWRRVEIHLEVDRRVGFRVATAVPEPVFRLAVGVRCLDYAVHCVVDALPDLVADAVDRALRQRMVVAGAAARS